MRHVFILISLLVVDQATSSESPNFEDHVLPIFREHCNGCHNPDKKKADLDLTTYAEVLDGSSGGEVVLAGVPDTSWLYETITHADGAEPMPPREPKIDDADIEIIHRWISGGLLQAKDGRSKLRDVSFDLSSGSMDRPDDPAIPTQLPNVPLAETITGPPILALASSPWTNLIAASGHEQILLFGERPAAIKAANFEPVAKDSLFLREDFEDEPEEGVVGQAWIAAEDRELAEFPTDFLNQNGAFSFSAWIRPDADLVRGTIFGRYSFDLFLEKAREGWKARLMTRSQDNQIAYFGRLGEIPAGSWQHLAVTCDGEEWVFYYDGVEVSRQEIPEDHTGFIADDRPFFIGGDGHHEDRKYRGGLDDLRIYQRALSAAEVATIKRNATSTIGHIGTLPFPEGDVHDLQFSRNGELLIAAGGRGAFSGKVAVYDVRTGELKATIADEQDVILSADISADHRFVAIGTPAKKVKIFSAENGEILHTIDKHTDWVTEVRFSPDGRMLATGDRNGGIFVWESETGGIVYTLDEHKVRITGLSWRRDGQLLASAAEDGKFVLWDMKDGWATRTAAPHSVKQEPSRYTRHTGILDIRFAQDGRFLTVGRDRSLRWWQTDGNALGEIHDLASLPTQAIPSTDGTFFVSGDIAGTIQIWDPATKSRIQTIHPFRTASIE
ncbi:MAG: LamG-like jellyroll fold domain-containing protein [Verrucomicrobiota bacterium]